jgi:hypothetical protein
MVVSRHLSKDQLLKIAVCRSGRPRRLPSEPARPEQMQRPVTASVLIDADTPWSDEENRAGSNRFGRTVIHAREEFSRVIRCSCAAGVPRGCGVRCLGS